MKRLLNVFLAVLTIGMLFVPKAEAKWWIFGQGKEDLTINYLYLNKTSFDESDNKITFYSDMLPDGTLNITGRASVKNAKIGYVKVTTDNKQNWEKAKLSDKGVFQYSFKPEIDKEYELYIEIADTTGRINNVEDTYKKIKVLKGNISELIRDALNGMINAYQNEESNLFMTYVSPDFAGDESVLDSAVRKDFTAFDYIKINYTINNISTDATGKAFVSLNYNRSVISSKSGRTYTDYGNTEFVFKNYDGKYKVFAMKNPLIFGLSDAGNVATGTIQSTNNNPIILVDESGNVDEKPFDQAIDVIEDGDDGGSGSYESGSTTLAAGDAWNFETAEKGTGVHFSLHGATVFVDTWNEFGTGDPWFDGKGIIDLGTGSLASVTSVPATGYSNTYVDISTLVGHVLAVHLSNTNYAVVKIVSWDGTNASLQFKYQPDGSTNF